MYSRIWQPQQLWSSTNEYQGPQIYTLCLLRSLYGCAYEAIWIIQICLPFCIIQICNRLPHLAYYPVSPVYYLRIIYVVLPYHLRHTYVLVSPFILLYTPSSCIYTTTFPQFYNQVAHAISHTTKAYIITALLILKIQPKVNF